MSRRIWTQEEVSKLEQHIRNKVERGEKLTCGEDTVWGRFKHEGKLTVRYVEEVDFYMDIHFEG